ncbi:hypothetical protein [Microbacterium kyungheense]|uniref:Uncharacterized protein n=1 Tax=Microbacterium kyungheense TaxID=1263636 RepID=A0A543FLF6_9MICO|nr:hypothetical protein [Microbacterium kyungheense]TQM34675.1 hypothetical protein FB391_0965 [Microbacterium kyungheense]
MTPRHARALRGTAAAAVATLVAATAHTLAGGGPPAPALVAAVGVLAAPFGVAMVGRRLSAWRIAVSVLASQVLFHLAFALTAGADPSAPHAHHVTVLVGGGGPAGAERFAAIALPDTAMLLAHVLAAVATVAGLYGGERMLRALGRGIRSLLARVRVAPPPPSPALVAAQGERRIRPARTALSGVSRRGPPAFVTATP